MSDPGPLACRLEGGAFQERVNASRAVLRATVSVKEADGVYAFEFEATHEQFRGLTEWIDAERWCCPFLAFTLVIPPQGRPFRLEITGPENAREFIRAELLGAQ